MGLELDLNLGGGSSFDQEKIYDVLVIGGGPGGLSAAIYAKRKGLEVGIIAESLGGQVVDTSSVENYLGFENISGEALGEKFQSHVKSYDIPILNKLVTKIETGDLKKVYINQETVIQSKTLILATGSQSRHLNVPGEDQYIGNGISYCAICDGPLFKDKDVVVAGGANSAVEAAIDLSKIVNKVMVIQRSTLKADQVLIDKLKTLDNVEIYLGHEIQRIEGSKKLEKVVALNKETNKEVSFSTDGLFVEIGYIPNSQPFKAVVELNDKGEVIVDSRNNTSVPGIFAAGDITNVAYDQIVIAASEGAKAALTATDYLNKND